MHYALLVTDLVDSTKLTEELGDEGMAKLWVAHDRIARDLLERHRGREITKTDGFLLLFDEASDAVAYAHAYHAGLSNLNVKARVGIHVGPAVINENSPADVAKGAPLLEVEGIAKHIAARVMSMALGGQTLLTEEARAALCEMDLRIESHGFWRMKGVAEPVEVFEVGDESSSFCPPPDGEKVYRVVRTGDLWLPVKELLHNLPRERDEFVGRRDELRKLGRVLDEGATLVTVLGIAGTGKTRLVTRYGWSYLGDWPGGTWFCDLSEARDIEGIVSAVAQVLDVPLGKEDPVVQLGHAIAERGRCLLILDNFEQVTSHAEATVGKWLDRASRASFVVTSREVLRLPGETTMTLEPLDTKQSIELFSVRALQAKRDFTLTDEDRPHVESLVRLLDGLPLAIELVAARVRVMPPTLLLDRMSERFKLVASSGGRQGRHATLRGALDWSWDMLSADERSALAQLSVFMGGFTLEGAESVLVLDEAWPMDAVQALVDKSLVRRVSDERFDLLVSVQEYASQRLDELGGRVEAERRHGEHYARHGTDEALEALHTHGGVPLRRALEKELDNMLAACRRATARGDAQAALANLRAAWEVLSLRGPFEIARELAESLLGLGALPSRLQPEAARLLGHTLQGLGCYDEAHAQYDAALGEARKIKDSRLEGILLGKLGTLHDYEGRFDEARAHYDAALAMHRASGDRRSEGAMLINLGVLHQYQGQLDVARAHFDAALTIHREIGNRRSEGIVLGNLGDLHHAQGRVEEALAHWDAALTIHREVGNRRSEGIVLGNLGDLHHAQRQLDEARMYFEEAEVSLRDLGDPVILGMHLCGRARLEASEGSMEAARSTLTEAEALAVQLEVSPETELGREIARARAALEGA